MTTPLCHPEERSNEGSGSSFGPRNETKSETKSEILRFAQDDKKGLRMTGRARRMTTPLCHPEERSDEGSGSGFGPRNETKSETKSEILRFAQDDKKGLRRIKKEVRRIKKEVRRIKKGTQDDRRE
ncbi:MAG: hypothetical protein WCP58_08030 [bacterium]